VRVLGIETSCDETGLAIYDSQSGLLSHALHSQIELHQDFGGVVPELASRDHVQRMLPLLKEVMAEANSTPQEIEGIAYTAGPGLIGALMVGASVAKSLAYAWQVPSLGIHHMEGHLLAPMLELNPPEYPFVALLVSGGHTQLVDVQAFAEYQILGESIDDAAGEAFDKTAKMLGLDYPGGPAIERVAGSGDATRFKFPRPMTDRPGLDFSFSGLKTSARTTIMQNQAEGQMDEQCQADIAAGFEQAVADTLTIKCRRALEQTGRNTLVIAGGVSANRVLRGKLEELMSSVQGGQLHYARTEFCTDNGAMIAYAGCQRLMAGQREGLEIVCHARWPMNELPAFTGTHVEA